MSRRDRLRAAVDRQPVDRIPYAFWRHFPAVDRSPAGLAQATLRFHDRYGSDFLKITPPSGYAVEGWGCLEADSPEPDGHRPCARCAVSAPGDWRKIRPLDPEAAPGYVDQIETIVRIGFDRRIGDALVLPTLFSPLTVARKLSGSRLLADLREHPNLVLAALEAITETAVRFAERALTEGVGGIFYAVQGASRRLLTDEEYARFGEPYDRRVLEAVRNRSSLTVVHCHGEAPMLDRLARLPADAWSWEDRATRPALGEGKTLVPGAVVGGLDQWRMLRGGTPEETAAQAKEAVLQTDGLGLIVAPGCVLPPNTEDAPVAAAVRALGGPLRPILGIAR